jgi:DDE superfamily endonuclease
VLVLVAGAILSPGRRTVAAALRVVGLDQETSFTNYHRVLNRNSWSSRRVAGRLLRLLVSAFVPDGPVIIGLDDTLERRCGSKIKARGIYRDPVRSSHGHFVKASGLRWLSVMLLPDIPWAGRVWGLPFLTAWAPSERYAKQHMLLPGYLDTRRAVRRTNLHRCPYDTNLLPTDLSGPHAETRKCYVLRHSQRRAGGRLSAVLTMPS